MPIHERDPWRRAYFADIACPPDVHIPTDDADAWRWYPEHRWIYNKLLVAESQGIECAPHGIVPTHYPVFSKPVINLDGMGIGSRTLWSQQDYESHMSAGHMWMRLFRGEHLSSDAAVIDGTVHDIRHAKGFSLPGGLFDYWIIEADPRPALEAYLGAWIEKHLQRYTGMVNLESIDGHIIEVHLRVTDQWPDLYGKHWLDDVVELYSKSTWRRSDAAFRRPGYSIALFGPHGRAYSYPNERTIRELRAQPEISSVQITFHPDRPASSHSMPPGGFRLGVINAWSLAAGCQVRDRLRASFGLTEVTLPGQRWSDLSKMPRLDETNQARSGQRENIAGTMDRGEEKTGNEGEMIDKESELVLVSVPLCRPVEDTGKEQDMGRGSKSRFPKERTGQEAQDERELEKRRDPGEGVSSRDSGCGNVFRRRVHACEFEGQCHGEDSSKDGAAGEDRGARPEGKRRFHA